jgi:hypothetical protein
MKKTFYILLITCSLSISYAQKVTTKAVLSSALKDERLKSNQQLTTLAQGLKFHLPIIKDCSNKHRSMSINPKIEC